MVGSHGADYSTIECCCEASLTGVRSQEDQRSKRGDDPRLKYVRTTVHFAQKNRATDYRLHYAGSLRYFRHFILYSCDCEKTRKDLRATSEVTQYIVDDEI